MVKTSKEIEKEFIQGLKSTTGKDLNIWLTDINKSGIGKRNDIVQWLKSEKCFGHMNASLLTGVYLNAGKPVYAKNEDLLINQFTNLLSIAREPVNN